MLFTRALALLGVALVVGVLHSWLGPRVIWDLEEYFGETATKRSGDSTPETAPETASSDPSNGGLTSSDDPGTPPDADGRSDEDTTTSPDPGEDPDDGFVDPEALGLNISLEEAKSLFDQGITFIDARPRDEFEAGHIPYSYNLDANDAQAQFLSMREEFGLDQILVIYCIGGECHDSEYVAEVFVNDGYQNVHIFRAGYEAWVEAGFDIEEGPPLFGDG